MTFLYVVHARFLEQEMISIIALYQKQASIIMKTHFGPMEDTEEWSTS
jgi:hypothetical protein